MDDEDQSGKNKRFFIIITSVLCVAFGLIIIIGLGYYLKENYMIVPRYEYTPHGYGLSEYATPLRKDNYNSYNGNYGQDPRPESEYGC